MNATINRLFANPYNMDASGFYFETFEEFTEKSAALRDAHGAPVEEFMIDFIDGPDAQLFAACKVDQSNLEFWFDEVEGLKYWEKVALFYLVSVNGQDLEEALSTCGGGVRNIDDVSLFKGELKEAAEDLFDELYLSDVPERVRAYIDYDSFAQDCRLNGDMYEFEFNGETWTCTNANS
jgi:hypothetical protein